MCSMVKEDFLCKPNAITRNSAERYVSPEMAQFTMAISKSDLLGKLSKI